MRKFLVRALPLATLILFVLIMQSDLIYKKYFDKNNISNSITSIMTDVMDEKWPDADSKTQDLKESWQRVVKIIQYSAERDEIKSLDKNIARLRGAIRANDKAGALMELQEALEHWENIDE